MNNWIIWLVCLVSVVQYSTAQNTTEQPILPKKQTQKSGFFKWLWGEHYRELYAQPIRLQYNPKHQDINAQPYIDRFPYYQHFEGFQDLYHEELYHDTYLNQLLTDTYTMHYPLASILTDALALKLGLPTQDNKYYFVDEKLYFQSKNIDQLLTTDQVIELLYQDFEYRIDQSQYVRSRLLDMIIGNGLSVRDGYFWTIDNNEMYPQYINRQHAFLKKDGLLFNTALNTIGIPNLNSYYKTSFKHVNIHNYHTDLALAQQIDYNLWKKEAQWVQSELNEQTINAIFEKIKQDYPNYYVEEIKQQLLSNIANLQDIASYYAGWELQKIVVLTGSANDDIVEVFQKEDKTSVSIRNNNKEVFYAEYIPKYTQEIWIYTLEGKDKISVSGKNNIILRLVNEDSENQYEIDNVSNKTRVYTTTDAPIRKRQLQEARLYKTNNLEILKYNKKYPKFHEFNFVPGLLFDTDMMFRFGGKFTYTRYNFTRQPFSAKHELSWNHYFAYQYLGTFPSITGRKIYTLKSWHTSPDYFENFFGYGNESQNHESLFGMDYNRILLQRTGTEFGANLKIGRNASVKVLTAIERVKVSKEQNFVRDDIHINRTDSVSISNNNYGLLHLAYIIKSDKDNKENVSIFFSPEVGVILPINDSKKYLPYIGASLMVNWEGEKFTIASLMRAKALLNKDFKFFQSATMGGNQGLRGFRDNRFSGQEYFVHSTDLRYNLGLLRNKILPITYEAFIGFDYGRVWLEGEESRKWHTSVGGGFSFRLINKFPINFSYFTSSEKPRITLSMGYEF